MAQDYRPEIKINVTSLTKQQLSRDEDLFSFFSGVDENLELVGSCRNAFLSNLFLNYLGEYAYENTSKRDNSLSFEKRNIPLRYVNTKETREIIESVETFLSKQAEKKGKKTEGKDTRGPNLNLSDYFNDVIVTFLHKPMCDRERIVFSRVYAALQKHILDDTALPLYAISFDLDSNDIPLPSVRLVLAFPLRLYRAGDMSHYYLQCAEVLLNDETLLCEPDSISRSVFFERFGSLATEKTYPLNYLSCIKKKRRATRQKDASEDIMLRLYQANEQYKPTPEPIRVCFDWIGLKMFMSKYDSEPDFPFNPVNTWKNKYILDLPFTYEEATRVFKAFGSHAVFSPPDCFSNADLKMVIEAYTNFYKR